MPINKNKKIDMLILFKIDSRVGTQIAAKMQ